MDDLEIIDLYWKRDETAISETAKKYGAFCHGIAGNILSLREDAEECVSDTYYQAWESMPPARPENLRAWLGRVVRNIAINLWRKNHAQKRYTGIDVLMDELEDCIPSPETVEQKLEEAELTGFLNLWLFTLSPKDRILFIRRYWNGEAVKELARECGDAPAKTAKQLYRLRQNLKTLLEKEGYSL